MGGKENSVKNLFWEDVMDLIILAGSSGNGKTTVGKKLHELLKSPFMEFTWIPEFRTLNPHTSITPKKEEEIAFENMMLVCKNYGSYIHHYTMYA